MNRAKLAILAALAQEGGSADPSRLLEKTGLARTILIRYLWSLETDGYVEGVPPREERRRGVRVHWYLKFETLEVDVNELLRLCTPVKRPGDPKERTR